VNSEGYRVLTSQVR